MNACPMGVTYHDNEIGDRTKKDAKSRPDLVGIVRWTHRFTRALDFQTHLPGHHKAASNASGYVLG